MGINKFGLWLMAWGCTIALLSQNPIIRDQFTADPTARVFNGRMYVYPSHDIMAVEGKGRPGWFCMEDYHVFSSDNLTQWTDHGVIVSQNDVPWGDSTSYSMWAPDCVERNGKYYFYFPANNRVVDATGRKGFSIGVAIADHPEGPFVPQSEPIQNVRGIDPNVFIDKDGQAYLYWSMQNIYVAKLKDNMLELDSEPLIIANLPDKGLKEGPFVFDRNGLYYLTFPHVENNIERLEYAIGKHPMGPFEMTGVIMDESPLNCWTNHQSILHYNHQWYLFYHQNEYSPNFDKNRSICIDSLFFNADGTIRKVLPTRRGVGITPANALIEMDRYSAIGGSSAKIEFVDSLNVFKGWKTVFHHASDWIQYNAVDFGTSQFKTIQLKAFAPKGGTLQIRLNSIDGPLLGEVKVPASSDWTLVEDNLTNLKSGVHNLFVKTTHDQWIEVDWLTFK
ncbi:MAG: family 43 glycosylhydrolase [Marinilabiliaceae bacterium]|nr:family 43 glycosylhydrolase [Marinilabiliaceae bacterium]